MTSDEIARLTESLERERSRADALQAEAEEVTGRLYEQTQAAQAVGSVLHAIAGQHTIEGVLQDAGTGLCDVFGWATCLVWTGDAPYTLTFDNDAPASLRNPTGDAALGESFTDTAIVSEQLNSNSPRRLAEVADRYHWRMLLPLSGRGRVVAVLEFFDSSISPPDGVRHDALTTITHGVSSALDLLLLADREAAEAELRSKVEQLLDVVRAAEGGDLTRAVTVVGDDAIGQIGAGLATFFGDLRQQIEGIARASSTLASASEQLHHLASSLQEGASRVSTQSDTVLETSREVGASVESVALASEQVHGSIDEIAESTHAAADVAGAAVEKARNATAAMKDLHSSTDEIGKILRVITSISRQTNLLALNATIEAARAGDAGKGFAVVANEVKELARESAQAAGDISKKVDSIRSGTLTASKAIDEIGTIIDEINSFQRAIAESVGEQSKTTREIAASVTEASTGTERIVGAIGAVAEDARQTKSASTEATDAADHLAAVASELQLLISRFNIG